MDEPHALNMMITDIFTVSGEALFADSGAVYKGVKNNFFVFQLNSGVNYLSRFSEWLLGCCWAFRSDFSHIAMWLSGRLGWSIEHLGCSFTVWFAALHTVRACVHQ